MKFKLKLVFILLLIFTLVFSGCNNSETTGNRRWERPEVWTSKYTAEEHLQKLNEIVPKKLKSMLYVREEIYNLSIETVYAFDESPEYFVVEIFMRKRDDKNYGLFYDIERHIIGFIENDEYYFWGDLGTGEIFRNGYSKWKLESITYKKYLGGMYTYAYKDENGDFYGWSANSNGYNEKFLISNEGRQELLFKGLRNYSMKIS